MWAPPALNTCTRSLPVSATAIRLPFGEYEAACGASSCPSPAPAVPNLPANVPSGRNTCTRSLPVSATTSIPGNGSGGKGGANATEYGLLNCPSPLPGDPMRADGVPSSRKTWMRWLYVSATAILASDGVYAALRGEFSPDSPAPGCPKACAKPP